MRYILLTVALALFTACSALEPEGNSTADTAQSVDQADNANPDVQDYQNLVRDALARLREQSLYTSEVDWIALSKATDQQVADIQTEADMKLPLTTALNAIRDHHGRFIYNNKIFAHFTDWDNERDRDSLRAVSGMTRKFETEHNHVFESLDDGVGYAKITGIGPAKDINAEAKLIRNGLENLARTGVRKWILDLRYNTGGNMHPMLAGLGALLCDGAIGSEVDYRGDNRLTWSMKAGNFYYGDNNYIELPKSSSINCDAKTAVLISRYTASSGEVVATAFKDRPQTKFFGERSAGYTTVTNWEPISDDLFMSISVSYYVDRAGIVYKTTVPPDEMVEFIPELNFSEDKGIANAIEWLSLPDVQ